jgi:CRP-like cAMP-binding protein
MRDPAPLTVKRLLALRQFDGFSDIDLGELATLADNVYERAFEPGAIVVNAGAKFVGAYLILQGQLEAPGRIWGPRQLAGGLEMIAGRPSLNRIVATKPTRALLLPSLNFAELLEDNYGVLSTTRRRIAREMVSYDSAPFTPAIATRIEARPLGLVDRIVVLRSYLPIAQGKLQAIAALAQASAELHVPPGTQLHRAGDESAGPLVVVNGRVRLLRRSGSEIVATSAVLGALEALAEVPHTDDAFAVTPVRALRVPAAALFDVMEDHTDFAIEVVRRLASALLDVHRLPEEGN